MKLTKKIRHGLIATVLTISPLSTVLAQIQPALTANVGYILMVMYNDITALPPQQC